VRWAQRHGGERQFHCVASDGRLVSVPEWMTDPLRCAAFSAASVPLAAAEALTELAELLQGRT
jgi:hypothetical protein